MDQNYLGWQSDVIVDLIKRYGFDYIAMNPGASFRGLHDSLINYGGNNPPMLLCQHEETAVQIAHGYAKATNKPMAVILHNLVGLLHSNMAIYYAFIDRVPIFIMGATGPMDEGKRRPHIDWTHTALVQGNAVREYTKWDYQPTAIEGVPESFARAYSIMTTDPQGPIYMCYDAALQEEPLARPVVLPPPDAAATPRPAMPDQATLQLIADKLLEAEHPLIIAQYTGRKPGAFESLIELAEAARVPVWDANSALNFPNRHPLCVSMDKQVLKDRDVILGLDVRDWEKETRDYVVTERDIKPIVPESCEWLEIGTAEIGTSKWSFDYGRMQPCKVRALGDTALAMPELTRLVRARLEREPDLVKRLDARAEAIRQRHDAVWAGWQADAKANWESRPVALPRLAMEVWNAIEGEDWVLSGHTLKNWARKLWNFDKGHQHPGTDLGTATQIGISLGVALAHKGTGRIVVDIQPDGDLMFDCGALWVAAKYEIPILIVMFNNRAYYNDWDHQIQVARERGTDEARAHIGMDLFGPDPDFAMLARSMGCWAEGPIDDPDAVGPALRRAIEVVKSGKPALVDIITRHR